MPILVNPFTRDTSASTAALDASDEKKAPRRPSVGKPANRFTSLFTTSPKNRVSEVASQTPLNQQSSPSLTPSRITPSAYSLPSISLSTVTGEKSKPEDRTTTLFAPPSPDERLQLQRQHAAFGQLGSRSHLYTSRFQGGEFPNPIEDEPPLHFLLTTYFSYLILIILGHVRDFFGKRFKSRKYAHLQEQNGYAPLNSGFDNFYVRRLKCRISDCFARPTTGVPGRYITLLDRKSADFNETFTQTGTMTETLNMSSYNYLGFAQAEGPCADATEAAIRKYGVAVASSRGDVGTTDLHLEVEDLIAKFVGKPSALVYSMGFVTNAAAFPALVGKGSLIISDELNHASIRYGARITGAMLEIFKHNDMANLEQLLRRVISQGQPRTHRPWKKILVAVEGLYSMEGTMVNLPGLVALKHKYKFHLFVDEAHSIGALGPQGRGVCDYFNIHPTEVDILMGTLTKSFGANGGYIAASKEIIAKIRCINAATLFAEAPAPPVMMQIASALRVITGELAPGHGEERLQRLAFNSRYLRLGLKRLGFIVYGHDDSPIIPLLLFNPGKMPAFSREMLRRKISVVVVGYPATPLVSARARFCVSAAHTKDDLDRMLRACDQIGDVLQLKFSSGIAGGAEPLPEGLAAAELLGGEGPKFKKPRWNVEEVIKRGVEDVKVPLR